MNLKVIALALFGLVGLTSTSDVQMYPGLQLRVEQDFLHIFTKEFFAVLPVIMEYVNEVIPKEIDILNVKISDISFKDF